MSMIYFCGIPNVEREDTRPNEWEGVDLEHGHYGGRGGDYDEVGEGSCDSKSKGCVVWKFERWQEFRFCVVCGSVTGG